MSGPEDYCDDEEGFTGIDDVIAVGRKVIEMAERAKATHAAVPGAIATWFFEIDDVRLRVAVTVVDPS